MRLFLLFLLISPLFINAQKKPHTHIVNGTTAACSGPGHLPTLAQAVCGSLDFHENVVANCTGPNLPNPTSSCTSVSTDNSLWYKFHCYQAGTFGFTLTPDNASDDYDWEIMDVTGHPPTDVYTTELRVSLNLSGNIGATGCSSAGTSDISCEGGTPRFNRLLNLVAGHDYLLMVTNWSQSGQGYLISFNGDAVLTDNAKPTIANVAPVGCDPSKIKVTFSEDLLCSTITSSGSEFTISNGPHVFTGIVSDCSIGANSVPYVIINLQTPLAPGPYTLSVGNGTDGNTFQNVCKRDMDPVSDIPFAIPTPTPIGITAVNFTGCAPTVLNVSLSKLFVCNSVTASGSEFFITPGNPAISSVTYNCTAGRADVLSIHLQNPLPYGNYTLNVQSGTDGNTVRDTCGIDMATGYTIPFVIPQTTVPPVISSVAFDECKPFSARVYFDKPAKCSSIAPDGSDFVIVPAITSVQSVFTGCSSTPGSTYTNYADLNFASPLPAGNFSISIQNGTDGNTIADTCFSYMAVNAIKSFATTQAPSPMFDSVQYDKCEPNEIKVFYNKAISCGSIVASGAQWYITGPSPVNIALLGYDPVHCGTPNPTSPTSSAYSDYFIFGLSAPITTFGTYVLHNKAVGTFIIRDTCYAPQNTNETISFNVLGKPSAAFNSQVIWACEKDTIIFSHPGGNGVNSWHWEFSDGTTDTGQIVRHTFPITTLTINAKLTVSNGYCDNTADQDIPLGNTFTPLFSQLPKDTTCVNLPVTFTDESIGTGLQYLWKFGDATTFNGQAPPPHSYTTGGKYQIDLILTDSHGCMDTASHQILITPFATVDFTGLRSQYCTGNQVSLKGNFSRYIDSVRWDNGNGETIANKINVQFTYPNESVYTIALTGYDHYCGQVYNSKTFPVYTIPVVSLGNDTVLCPGVNMQIGVPFDPAYTYSWNTGAATSVITTDIFTRNYILLADNHGCSAKDDINIKLLPSCLIKVPNIFTPNGDGVNDRLQAMDADLAKSFSLKVYNRLGELMFTTTDPMQGWDGKYKGNKAENGTYVWELNYVNPWTGKPVSEKGTAILMR